MNISAAMGALRTDLPPMPRLALVMLACRADRYSGVVTRSLSALADDMGASTSTAKRAVHTLARRGYVQVTHTVGITSTYQLTTGVTVTRVTGVTVTHPPGSCGPVTGVTVTPYRRKTREKLLGAARSHADTAAAAPVETPPRGGSGTWAANPRAHPPGCTCGGAGWVDTDTGEVAKCEG